MLQRGTTQEGQSQTTKIVKDPTETGHTSDAEVIENASLETSASGRADTDRHRFFPDDQETFLQVVTLIRVMKIPRTMMTYLQILTLPCNLSLNTNHHKIVKNCT
jgi:hypothetical protein